ncbi:hypothetical protein B1H10_06265 [candidate division KSB1 bacterium 4484_188]|nr:MAG: hypothetical protein B1H10_06265 [candidate division KSB1 bacterium 4484_188]HFE63684.1 YtxH domain-containing protein [Caldithrix sp.]
MENGRTTEFLKGLLIGGIVGSVVALLYAPKSGKETREDISKKTDELLVKAKDEYEARLEQSKKAYESAIQRLKELEGVARKKVEEVEEKVEELSEKGKETVAESKGRLKKAIDAGVGAFKEEKESKKKKA